MANSYEKLFHDAGIQRHLLDFKRSAELKRRLAAPQLERFIGVIYRPETERGCHDSEASISEQFDACIWFDRTGAVHPLGPEDQHPAGEDTFPFGL
jgi:erythromycin esterase-like protein